MSDGANTDRAGYFKALEKQKRIRCFMDGIDWQHHLAADAGGSLLFPSEDSLRESAGHSLDECGIVEVEVRLVRWTVPQDLHRCEKSGGHDWQDRDPTEAEPGPWKECSRCGAVMVSFGGLTTRPLLEKSLQKLADLKQEIEAETEEPGGD